MSNATCAACGERIPKRTRFVIAGTEVFHPDCIANIPRSRAHRLADKVRDAKAENDRVRFELEAARETLRREVESTRSLRSTHKVEIDWERSLAADAGAVVGQLRRELAAAERSRDQAQAAHASARAELALQKTLGPSPVRTDGEPVDTRDPLEVRASLLELDLP